MHSEWEILVFCAYFAILIGIAFLGSHKIRDMSDYVLAGRRLGSFTAALSAGSSTTSAWTMLTLPALAFSSGALEMWVPAAAAVGVWSTWTFLGKRLRRYTIEANDVLTIPGFFEARVGDKTGTLRTLTSIITIFFVIFYVSFGLVGGSKLLETIFGIDAASGVLITLVAVASYILIGGFLAGSRTDVFQAVLMFVGFLIMITTVIISTENPLSGIGSNSPGFLNPFTDSSDSPITLTFVLSAAGWGFGAFGAQRLLQRFMALEREDRIAQKPQHLHCLACRRLRVCVRTRTARPSRSI